MALLILADAKLHLGIEDDEHDDLLQTYVDAAPSIIARIVGPIDTATLTKTFNGGVSTLLLPTGATAIVSVTSSGVPLVAGVDYVPRVADGIVYAGTAGALGCFDDGVQNIVVQYTVGSASPAANLKLAACELIRYWWQDGQQGNRPAFGDPPEPDTATPEGVAVRGRIMVMCSPEPPMPGFA